ncbi:hypothetical protein LTR53_007882 [Teratosphaeriaceae sp. CCFEE 6253]|nr:hypothetical protein LTR53_007882 [Teratosphaeriaceae sp. CCFEE 6253]
MAPTRSSKNATDRRGQQQRTQSGRITKSSASQHSQPSNSRGAASRGGVDLPRHDREQLAGSTGSRGDDDSRAVQDTPRRVNVELTQATDPDHNHHYLLGSARCKSKRGDGTVSVHFNLITKDHDPFHEFIQASISFHFDGAESATVGVIDLDIIDKDARQWKPELLTPKVATDLAAVSQALRSLCDINGNVQRDLVDACAGGRDTDTVVYLSTIRIDSEYRGLGLGPTVMQVAHRMLAEHLGNDDDFTMLLQPDMLQEAEDVAGKTPKEVEQARAATQGNLIRFYGRCGYKTWYEEEPEDGAQQGLALS